MYCTQCLLHKLPILITLTLNINDLCEGADCIIFLLQLGFSAPPSMSRPKYLPETFQLGPLCQRPRRKLVMKAELPRTPASQACLRSARLFGVQRRASVVHSRRPFPLKHLGLLCSSVAASLQTQCMEKHWQKIRPLVHFLSPAAPAALGVTGSL